jgi:SAM-dependent methyltransferase
MNSDHRTHFHNLDLAGKNFAETQKGVFLTLPVEHMVQMFDQLEHKAYIKSTQLFLDAGSGDGRLVSEALYRGLDAFGIEHEPRLVTTSQTYFKQPKSIIEGDFGDLTLYKKHNKDIEDIDVFFNYENNYSLIANLVSIHAKPGAIFILFTFNEKQPSYRHLTLIDSLPTSAPHILTHTHDDFEQQLLGIPKMTYGFARIYRKEQ